MHDDIVPQKICSKCKLPFPATREYFSPNSQNKDGFAYACKACRRAASRAKNNSPKLEQWQRREDAKARGMKYCRPCGKEYEPTADNWYFSKDGEIDSRCKFCRQQDALTWANEHAEENRVRAYERYWDDPERARMLKREDYARHREKRLEYHRRYFVKNAAHIIERVRQWKIENADHEKEWRYEHYRLNRERLIASRTEWGKNNPEKRRAISDAYIKRHPARRRESANAFARSEKGRAARDRRRALEYGAEGEYSHEDIALQVKAQTNKKGELRCWWCSEIIKGTYHVDHRNALSVGGTNWPDNLCLTCEHCNLSKGARTPAEFAGRLF